MSAVQEHPTSEQGRPGHEIPIQIDHKPYKAPKPVMTGIELRALPNPPVSQEYDLWLENPGPEDDIKVGDNMPINLKEGMHFYLSPKTINPGA
jgi:hypothetical protein